MTRNSKNVFVPAIVLIAGMIIAGWSFVGVAAADTAPKRVQVSGKLMGEKLKYRVAPVYPVAAREYDIYGTVKLTAVIGTDGSGRSLTLQSGHPLLVAAALDAVKQWKYEPTLVDGEPVEVVTAIEVVFRKN
jgi:protein TonB